MTCWLDGFAMLSTSTAKVTARVEHHLTCGENGLLKLASLLKLVTVPSRRSLTPKIKLQFYFNTPLPATSKRSTLQSSPFFELLMNSFFF